MKRGAYIVNTARGKICDRDAILRILESGQLAGRVLIPTVLGTLLAAQKKRRDFRTDRACQDGITC